MKGKQEKKEREWERGEKGKRKEREEEKGERGADCEPWDFTTINS